MVGGFIPSRQQNHQRGLISSWFGRQSNKKSGDDKILREVGAAFDWDALDELKDKGLVFGSIKPSLLI